MVDDELWTAVKLRALRHGPVQAFYSMPAGLRVRVVEDVAACEEELARLLADDPDAIGLDTEWSGPDGAVALLQLASRSQCVLVRLPRLPAVPDALLDVLARRRPLKCGVSIAQDLRLLQEQYGFPAGNGIVDLRVPAMQYGYTDQGLGLSALCQGVLGAPLCKAHHLRCSAWDGDLSPAQVRYAACDAYAAVAILTEMHQRCGAHQAGQDLPAWCEEFEGRTKLGRQPQQQPAAQAGARAQPRRTPRTQKQSRLYDSCRLLSPEGEYLYSVGHKKAKWYLNRGLADFVTDTPFTLRLSRLPGEHFMDPLYLQGSANHCAGCGSEGSNVRFSVVPHAFRKHLDAGLQDYVRHDVLLLCSLCFRKAEHAARAFSEELLRDGGLEPGVPECAQDARRLEVRRAAGSLLNPKLPEAIAEEKMAIIRAFYGKADTEPVTQADVDAARSLSCVRPGQRPVDQERAFLEKSGLVGTGGIGDAAGLDVHGFIVSWRRVFMDAVVPRHLPEGWELAWRPPPAAMACEETGASQLDREGSA